MIQVENTCYATVKLEIQLVFLFRLCDVYLLVKLLKCSVARRTTSTAFYRADSR